MKTLPIAALAATLALATPLSASADGIHGIWQTAPDDDDYAHIEMIDCSGGKICGRVVKTFDAGGEYPSDEVGQFVVRNMVANAEGTFEGKVWDPKSERAYFARIEVKGDTLALDGCILGGLICREQIWTRVN